MRGTTIYLYELAWFLPSVAIPVGMLVALMVTAFGAGIHVPGDAGRVDPTKLTETVPQRSRCRRTRTRALRGQDCGRYLWLFTPNEIRVPAGATVTFVATSRDVLHGFSLHDVNVNLMLLPGRVARATLPSSGRENISSSVMSIVVLPIIQCSAG